MVKLGDVEEPFRLVIDTGSSDLGVATKGCSGCASSKNFYTPSPIAEAMNCTWCEDHVTNETSLSCVSHGDSNTKQCTYDISYAGGNGYEADILLDTVAFDSKHSVKAYVGAIYEATMFFPGFDGIIGFAGPGESCANTTNPFTLMSRAGEFDDVFTLCLTRDDGKLYLGSNPKLMSDPNVIWVPRSKSAFYGVTITDVLVGDKSIGIKDPSVYNEGSSIIDSGTTDCDLPQPAFDALVATLGSFCADTCLKGVCDCAAKKPHKHSIFESRCVDMT